MEENEYPSQRYLETIQRELGVATPHEAIQRARQFRQRAADHLLLVMEEISEEEWCAGWMEGLERILWERTRDPRRADQSTQLLRELAALADGWWVWANVPLEEPSRRFVPLAEWEPLYAEMAREFAARNAAYLATKGGA
jgi:hypothetical protein